MKKFDFKLQTVLDKRTIDEEEAQRILGECRRELVALQKKLQDLKDNRDRCQDRLKATEGCTLDQSERRQTFLYLGQLRDAIDGCVAEIQVGETAVEQARLQLIEATKNKSIVEKLKDKQKKAHSKAVAVHEQKTLDDISITKYARSGE